MTEPGEREGGEEKCASQELILMSSLFHARERETNKTKQMHAE